MAEAQQGIDQAGRAQFVEAVAVIRQGKATDEILTKLLQTIPGVDMQRYRDTRGELLVRPSTPLVSERLVTDATGSYSVGVDGSNADFVSVSFFREGEKGGSRVTLNISTADETVGEFLSASVSPMSKKGTRTHSISGSFDFDGKGNPIGPSLSGSIRISALVANFFSLDVQSVPEIAELMRVSSLS